MSPALASGGRTDTAKLVGLPLFLNAAHGSDFSWSNQPDREKALKTAATPPSSRPHSMELPWKMCILCSWGNLTFSKISGGATHSHQASWVSPAVLDVVWGAAIHGEEAVQRILLPRHRRPDS